MNPSYSIHHLPISYIWLYQREFSRARAVRYFVKAIFRSVQPVHSEEWAGSNKEGRNAKSKKTFPKLDHLILNQISRHKGRTQPRTWIKVALIAENKKHSTRMMTMLAGMRLKLSLPLKIISNFEYHVINDVVSWYDGPNSVEDSIREQ